jgi:hypothetical protein
MVRALLHVFMRAYLRDLDVLVPYAGSRVAFRRVIEPRTSGPHLVPPHAAMPVGMCPRMSSVTVATREDFTTHLPGSDCAIPALVFASPPRDGRVPPAGTMSPSLHAMLVRVFTQCLAHRFQPAQRQLPLEVNVRER